jgi:hypothetical protein
VVFGVVFLPKAISKKKSKAKTSDVLACKQAEIERLAGAAAQNNHAMLPGNRITSALAGRQRDRVFPAENAIPHSQVLVNFPPRKPAFIRVGNREVGRDHKTPIRLA